MSKDKISREEIYPLFMKAVSKMREEAKKEKKDQK